MTEAKPDDGATAGGPPRYADDDPRWGVRVVDCRRCRRLCYGPGPLPAGAGDARPDTVAEFVGRACNRGGRFLLARRTAVRRWVGPGAADVEYLCPECAAAAAERGAA